ncbi:NAD(P)-dependent dehydrogenase (short-subunit alcohol dehydrogenase family) [Mycolicibacterium sp. BK634]|uniref:SDR family NAD(P)-dependent oxidoreductase n=1 Tax=Mycobacteriaceae TaxID=1762 RepID=UPI00105E4A22|nr:MULTISPECIES: glucose 1-dehydrogenase [Mycobacteriaceae]MBB3749492.1 NAD(P)-dependent dehydrogenase (short-subunit alcohol dehydrogenase family) [Mycolicibacterium sp. BK634]TDO14290.1 NAD(P)-dependent dehydrogenase (short-subunit alcohol dehydrogenase family) [Mycobacterium sp. BK086]
MTDPLFDLTDRVVLITGGSRGLGAAMSRGLAERGARVIIASRKLGSCEELATQIEGTGGQAHPLQCHVGDWESLDAVVNAATERWGRLDGLVNNAGMSPLAPSLLETSEALFDKVIGVNLKGPTRLTALAAAAMAQTGGGSIVNISSLASVKQTPVAPIYGAAKAGLNALTKATALEYANANIRVNCIICGTFDTDAASGFVRNPDTLPGVVRPIALGRVGRPEEIVGAVVYLLSDASSYTTGSLMTIDGGVSG